MLQNPAWGWFRSAGAVHLLWVDELRDFLLQDALGAFKKHLESAMEEQPSRATRETVALVARRDTNPQSL